MEQQYSKRLSNLKHLIDNNLSGSSLSNNYNKKYLSDSEGAPQFGKFDLDKSEAEVEERRKSFIRKMMNVQNPFG